eukprot:329784-Pelagomonas_calceolata.AAC.1
MKVAVASVSRTCVKDDVRKESKFNELSIVWARPQCFRFFMQSDSYQSTVLTGGFLSPVTCDH